MYEFSVGARNEVGSRSPLRSGAKTLLVGGCCDAEASLVFAATLVVAIGGSPAPPLLPDVPLVNERVDVGCKSKASNGYARDSPRSLTAEKSFTYGDVPASKCVESLGPVVIADVPLKADAAPIAAVDVDAND